MNPSNPCGKRARLATLACVLFLAWTVNGLAESQNPNIYPPSIPTVDLTAQYRLQRLFPQRKFDCPVALAIMPAQVKREVLILQRGEVWLLPANRLSADADLFLD